MSMIALMTGTDPFSGLLVSSRHSKVMGGHRQQGDFISLLLFFENKESRLINTLNGREGAGFIWFSTGTNGNDVLRYIRCCEFD
jgi:hypothetical protein